MDILNKKKVGGRGGQTDYVFHFHFVLCLNKQFLTALFSKPTFSQLLSGTTERENNTQDVQDYLTLHTRFTQQSVIWLHKSQGELLGISSSLGETGCLHNRWVLGGFTQTHTTPGEQALCQVFVTGPNFATGADPLPSTDPQQRKNLENDSEQQLREEVRINSS